MKQNHRLMVGGRRVQRAMWCPCGRGRTLALGLCSTCYTLRRQDMRDFGGLREAVLTRDHYRCRCCERPGGRKRTLAVHHRRPGVSELRWMITLCLRCHAKLHRTIVARRMAGLLLVLWREQHPQGHEQLGLPFSSLPAFSVAEEMSLFEEMIA